MVNQLIKYMQQYTLYIIVLLFLTPVAKAADEVNVYSARKAKLIEPLLDRFSQQSGIKVNLITGKDDALIKRLQLEGSASPADVLITVDAGRLHRAKQADLLQTLDSDILNKAIPVNLRDQDKQWFGISMRARPIFYVKGKINPADLSTYENLADPKWRGKVCIRSSSNIYNQSLLASMLEANGTTATQAWATNFIKNMARPPAGGDTDQLRAAAAGVCDIAIANTYYFGRLSKSNKPKDKMVAEKLAIFWPNQNDRGTHVNISGVAMTKAAKNKLAAQQLMEFLVSAESQAWYASINNEYPVIADAETDPVLASWGNFKKDSVLLNKLGTNNQAAVKIMDKAAWK